MRKRLLSTLLALCMVLTLLPTRALAASEETTEADIWDGSIATGFESGSGTAANPYQIATGAQLAYLASSVKNGNNYSGKYFLQTRDLVLAGHEWLPIGSNGTYFKGSYDGGGHTITGLTLTETSSARIGLFGGMDESGSVKNLTLVNATVRGNKDVGGIVGFASGNDTIISNCHIQNSIITGTENVGGIAGNLWWGARAENSIVDSDSTVTGTTSIGGIVGYIISGSAFLCGNNAPVTGTDNVGGIVGFAYNSNSDISQCYNKGTITGSTQVGGVCGLGNLNVTISNCYNVGEVWATSSDRYEYVGGIAARNYQNGGSTSCCYNYGNVYKAGTLRNDVIVGDSWGASVSNCYYLSQDAVSNGGGLTKDQMADRESFSGFDFQSIWAMNSTIDRPVLRNQLEVPTTLYCNLVVIDAITYLPVEGVLVTEDGSWSTFLGWTSEDGTISLSDSVEKFTSETTLFFTKEGYQPFVCFYKDLDADSYRARPQNSIYMVPDNQDPGEDSNEQIFINEHISFIKNRYDKIIYENDFYDTVWQYDEGKRMWAVYLWEVVGDLGEVVTLKLDDLVIQADYYDLFISDLILTLTNNQFSDRLLTKATDAYDKAYKKATDNVVTNLISLLEKDELFRRDLEDIFNKNSTINKNYGQIIGDIGLLKSDLRKLLEGKAYEMDAATTIIYDKFFSKLKVDQSLFASVFEGLNAADTIVSSYTDTLEFAMNITDAFILGKSCIEVNNEVFDLLLEAVDEMESTNPRYADKLKKNLNEYKSVATDLSGFVSYQLRELYLNLADGLYNYFVKDALKECTNKYISSKLNIGIPQLKALIGLYNGTYKIFNKITKNHEKGEQYCIMNYIAPFERGLEAVVRAKGVATVSEQTYECAKEYDLAYSLLRYTNKYLYESAYNFAELTHNPNDQYYATAYKNAWNLAKCHNTVIADRSKYISVKCPVDVYLYGPNGDLVLSVIDDEVALCNDEALTVMVCNGEKAIMYPADTDYTIKIVACTEGTMDYSVVEVVGTEPVRYVDFYDLSLQENQTYTGSIPADFRIDNVVYTLQTNLTEISCDYDSDATPECDLNGHSYGEWVTEIEPTAEDFGLKKRTCSICGKVESLSIEPTKTSTYTVTIRANPAEGGSVTMTGNGTYNEGDSVTVQATPAIGYRFVRWTEGGEEVSTSATYTFDITADRTLTAVFEAETEPDLSTPTTYEVTVNASPAEGGSVTMTGNGTYNEGDSVTVQAIPASGFRFVCWMENGQQVGTSETYTFTVKASTDLTAVFESETEPEPPATTPDSDTPENPDIPESPDIPENPDTPENPDLPENSDTPQDPDAPENPGTPWIPDTPWNPGVSSDSEGYYDGSSSSGSSYPITTPVTPNGTVTISPKSARSGAKITIIVTPNEGYTTGNVNVTDRNGKSISVTDNGNGIYTFTMPASQVTVDITFAAIEAPSLAPDVPNETSWVNPFTDVSSTDWFYPSVQYVSANGLMIGDGSMTIFNPAGTMTRAMVWTVLGRMAGADVNGTGNEWYAKAQDWAIANNVSDGTNPSNSISRQELMTMLWRYSGSPVATADLSQFSDYKAIADWADDAMQWAVSTGLLIGDNGRLNPVSNARRCEVVTIFMRFCENIIE